MMSIENLSLACCPMLETSSLHFLPQARSIMDGRVDCQIIPSMATLADELCKHYPQLDRDLLVSAALIHDVGKTAELSGPVTTEYTLEGKLEGHISLANAWLSEVSEKLGVQEREETVLMHHMILSHHGKMEYGSPVAPMIMEAEALYLIDNMDARLTSLKMALDAIKPGTWTSRMFQFENRQFYKHK